MNRIRRTFYSLESVLFDFKYHVKTGGWLTAPQVKAQWGNASISSNGFQGAWIRSIRVLCKQDFLLLGDGEPSAFVDVGCGRGRACLYASLTNTRSYSEIIGWDISFELIGDANRNIQRCSARRTLSPVPACYECDALTAPLPDMRTQIFMFNSFSSVAMEGFISAHLDHFRQHNSTLTLVNDQYEQVLRSNGFDRVWFDDDSLLSVYRLPLQ